MQKYNYVIFQTPLDYYNISYSDLYSRKDVIYKDKFLPKSLKIVEFLYRVHHSKKINSFLSLPFKNIWFSSYFKNSFCNNLPFCFIFDARWMQYPCYKEYVSYLRKLYNNAKFVCFYQDLVDTHKGAEPNIIFNLFDLLLSYDKGDAEKFGLTYHPTVYSNYKVANDKDVPESDVYFIGLAKDRLDLILDVFHQLKNKGISCLFYLSGVPSIKQVEEDGLNYIDKMSYIENLKHVVRTKCILEIVQGKAKGSTIRTWEAIMYDKKLLTNNLSIVNDYYFDSNYIRIFNEKFIDVAFLKQNNTYLNPYKNQISPNKFLDFITQKL